MAIQASVTLNTKVYNPRGTQNSVSSWALVGDTSFGGAESRLTESVRGPSKDGITRVLFKLTIPKAAETSGSCSCEGDILATAIANIEVVIPARFTAAERTDLRTRIQNLVAHSVFQNAVDSLEGVW